MQKMPSHVSLINNRGPAAGARISGEGEIMIGQRLKQVQFCLVLACIVLLSICSALHGAQDRKRLAKTHIPEFEKILKKNIASFWYDRSPDRENGGYTIDFGPKGDKANPWKAGYHNGRAMIECLEILKQWRKQQG